MRPRSPKKGFLARRNFKRRQKTVANLSEPFVMQYNLRWIVVFPPFLSWILSRKKPCSTSTSEKRCLQCCQLDAGSLWSFKSFREYVHICTIKGSTILERMNGCCPLTVLIDAHIKKLKEYANLANKNYCGSIRRRENLEIIHNKIFLTSTVKHATKKCTSFCKIGAKRVE